MMGRRRWVVLIVVCVVLAGLAFAFRNLSLYSFRHESQVSTASASFGNEMQREPRIGIVVENLGADRKLKSRLASYFKEALIRTGHGPVYLLQDGKSDREPLDLILVLNMDLSLSRIPFYKTGRYGMEIKTIPLPRDGGALADSSTNFEYHSSGNFTIAGLATRGHSEHLILQAQAEGFAKGFNKHLNENHRADNLYGERSVTVSLGRKIPTLTNTVQVALKDQYADLIPAAAHGLFIYSDKELGDRVLLTYTSDNSMEELLEFFADQGGSDFLDCSAGRKGLHINRDDRELRISIRYLDDAGFLNPRELKERTVTIFRWLKPAMI